MSENFSAFNLTPSLQKNIVELGYEKPTAIQAECIPLLIEGHDLIGQAQTGTGKTAAFALPLLNNLRLDDKSVQVLVLAPTRELALQVAEAFQRYARGSQGFHVIPLYGGQNYNLQLKQLKRGAEVIVGTPGRVMDHLRRGTLKLNGLQALVLDEADEMLKMGFIDDIEWIIEQTPKEKQTALFSATMPDRIRRIAKRYLRNPKEIKVKSETATVSTIDQHHIVVIPKHKLDALTRVLEVEEFDAMIIFVRTRTATVELKDKLEAHGFSADAINGDMSQDLRERMINRLKRGELDILVATDVAARGLDVERISHVVNYDIPYDAESYVHRIGRTGRAGRAGKALLFVAPRERRLLGMVEKSIGRKIPAMHIPDAGDLQQRRVDRFLNNIKETLNGQNLDFYYQLIERIADEEGISPTDLAAVLTYQSQRERPFVVQELSSPPDRQTGKRTKQTERKSRDNAEKPAANKRSKRKRDDDDDDIPFVAYRIEVGKTDGATPREIVGAIANEAGVEGQYIRRVKINEEYSTVDLPDGMPKEIFQHLRKVRVCGKTLKISPAGGGKEHQHKAKKGKPSADDKPKKSARRKVKK